MSIDWQLDPLTWDLKIGEHTDYRVGGIDELVQRLSIRLKFFRGELYFDTTQGVPYYEEIFKKGVTYDEISGAIKLQIVTTEGITKLTSFVLSAVDNEPRSIRITFTADSEVGIVEFKDFGMTI